MSNSMRNKKYLTSIFTCQREKFRISGKIYRPNTTDDKCTPVIICHGFMGNQREGMPEAIALAENGYVAFTFDFVGGTTLGKSDGKPTDMSIFTEKADLRVVMDYVKSLDYVDYSKLVIAGCSQGGLVAGLVAADYSDEVKRLILLYPALCIPDHARAGQMQIFKFDPNNVPDIIESHGRKINGDYARLVMDMDAIDVISNYPGPVLLTCGEKDQVVDYAYMERLIAAFRKKRSCSDKPDNSIQFFPVQDAIHGFRGKEISRVSHRIVSFMDDYDEILTIHVNITDNSLEHHGIYNTSYVSFKAECDNYYFKGKSLPGAMDVQKRRFAKIVECKADYVMRGIDYVGEKCNIHIINLDTGNGWIPTVETDSKALAFMNHQQCITIAEEHKEGLIIHILAKHAKQREDYI